MRRGIAFVLAGLLIVTVTAVGRAPTVAQEATPAVSDAGRDTPDPAECTVAPRPPESLDRIHATPVTGEAPTPPAVPFGAPDGIQAGPEDAAAITAAIRMEWACLNANDFPRTFALFTDDLLRRLMPPEELANLMAPPAEGTPTPVPAAEQTALFAVLDIELLGDNRAGAFVIVDTFNDPLPVEINYYLLVKQDDTWLMDDFLCFDEAGEPC